MVFRRSTANVLRSWKTSKNVGEFRIVSDDHVEMSAKAATMSEFNSMSSAAALVSIFIGAE